MKGAADGRGSDGVARTNMGGGAETQCENISFPIARKKGPRRLHAMQCGRLSQVTAQVWNDANVLTGRRGEALIKGGVTIVELCRNAAARDMRQAACVSLGIAYPLLSCEHKDGQPETPR